MATFVYIGVFDIGDHPLQLAYIGAYVSSWSWPVSSCTDTGTVCPDAAHRYQ